VRNRLFVTFFVVAFFITTNMLVCAMRPTRIARQQGRGPGRQGMLVQGFAAEEPARQRRQRIRRLDAPYRREAAPQEAAPQEAAPQQQEGAQERAARERWERALALHRRPAGAPITREERRELARHRLYISGLFSNALAKAALINRRKRKNWIRYEEAIQEASAYLATEFVDPNVTVGNVGEEGKESVLCIAAALGEETMVDELIAKGAIARRLAGHRYPTAAPIDLALGAGYSGIAVKLFIAEREQDLGSLE